MKLTSLLRRRARCAADAAAARPIQDPYAGLSDAALQRQHLAAGQRLQRASAARAEARGEAEIWNEPSDVSALRAATAVERAAKRQVGGLAAALVRRGVSALPAPPAPGEATPTKLTSLLPPPGRPEPGSPALAASGVGTRPVPGRSLPPRLATIAEEADVDRERA